MATVTGKGLGITDFGTKVNNAGYVKSGMDKESEASTKIARSQRKQIHEMEILWINVGIFVVMHTAAVYGFYQLCTYSNTPWKTTVCFWVYGILAGIGITGGAHRLWAHRAYKARLPMRIILMLMQSASHQNSVYTWVRDHRAHHKFTDTDADPHNATRGFFFSHMGWLVVKKHPDIRKRGAGIDMSDIINDPVLAFQKKYFNIIMPLMCFIIPTLIPMYFWGETFKIALPVTFLRYTLSLHFTWLVNSAAHLWGNKPYNKFISSSENLGVAIFAYGEGWHNYHHVFPWDYKAAELGNYGVNWTTAFIDFFALFGLAYDLKTVPIDAIKKRCEKTGDGSSDSNDKREVDVWGWDDKDMSQADKQATTIFAKDD